MGIDLQPGQTVNNRYHILRQLGQGHLGRTYLAKNGKNSHKYYIIKEFAADLTDPDALRNTEKLFQREAQVLYTLDRPQIAQFHELFILEQESLMGLFLVQDYVEGATYRELLNHRLSTGETFSEAEIIQLLRFLLPVLQYLHDQGIIHRDIRPDNIMQRHADKLPVLIDFGSIKQLSIIATTFFTNPQQLALRVEQIGKEGYAPSEQIQQGLVFPHSDLYGLAATAVVLLTGKEPPFLLNPHTSTASFLETIALNPSFKRILGKMLAQEAGDRYASALDVLACLPDATPQPQTPSATVAVNPDTLVPEMTSAAIVAPSLSENEPTMALTTSPAKTSLLGCLGKLTVVLLLVVVSGTLGWIAGKLWIERALNLSPSGDINPATDASPSVVPSPSISEQEIQRKNELRSRRQNLGIDPQFFVALVDRTFGDKYPAQQGKTLTEQPEDAPWREKWDRLAAEWLDRLSLLSPQARQGLGTYNQAQRDSWKQQANNLHLSSRALFDLTDARFFAQFPEQEAQNFLDLPIGQVWSAMALDVLTALQAGEIYEEVALNNERSAVVLEGTLQPGGGKAYILPLAAAQQMAVVLESDRNTWLSIYSPSSQSNLLADSTFRQWSGELPESGYYELIVVSKSDKPLTYQLRITLRSP